MAAPNDLTASPKSPSSILLTWTNQANYFTISVEIFQFGSWYEFGTVRPPSQEEFLATGLSGDTEYKFRLHTWEWQGDELIEYFSNEATARTYPALSAPADLEATAYGTHIDLTWTAVSLAGVDGIQVWRDAGSGYSLLATVWPNVEFYRDSSASAGGSYSYKLRTVSGSNSSNFTDPVSVVQYGAPSNVENFYLVSAGSTHLKLGWSDPPLSSSPVAGYILEQYVNGAWQEINRIPFGVNETFVKDLSEETSYSFRIKAYNARGSSGGTELACATVSKNETPENRLLALLRLGRLNPVLTLKIILPENPLVFLNQDSSAWSAYSVYPHFLLPGEINFSLRVQEFWRPGLVGSSGSIEILRPPDSAFDVEALIGRKVQLFVGDASFAAESDFLLIGGGVISGVGLTGGKLTISWEDSARALNKTIYLFPDANGNLKPKIYGSVYATGTIEDLEKKKIRFCDHRIYSISDLTQNGVAVDSSDYVVDFERGCVYLDPGLTVGKDDVFTATVIGYRNLAGEPVLKASDVITALCWEQRTLFDLAQLSWLKTELEDTYNIGLIISERENYIDVLRRIFATAKLHAFNLGDVFCPTRGGRSLALAIDESVYHRVGFSRMAEDMISSIFVSYGYGSQRQDENTEREEISGAPENAGELEVQIYGNASLAKNIISAIRNYANLWSIEIELALVPAGIQPGDVLSVGGMSVWVREFAASLSTYTARISGLIVSSALEEIITGEGEGGGGGGGAISGEGAPPWGDMLKSVYDQDGDGVVEKSAAIQASRSNIAEIDGDLWVASNAQYDAAAGQWNRIDTSRFALAIQIQGQNNIPGDSVQGITLWRAIPGENPIGDFGAYGGWEAIQLWTAYRDTVLGGFGLEVDGNGTSPYGRFVHSVLSSVVHSGVLTNFFADFSGRDATDAPSWFAGIAGDEFALKRATGATPIWKNPFRVASSGGMFFVPLTEEPNTADMKDGELCFFLDLNAGTLKGKYRYDANTVYVFTVATL